MFKKHWLRFLITALIFILLGMLRDFVFVNWNYQLDYEAYHRDFSYAHSFFNFLNVWTYKQLYWGKWLLTAFFVAFNFLVGYFFLKDHASQKKLRLLYLWVGSFALFIFSTQMIGFSKGYLLSREIMGFLQSPLPTIILYLTTQIKLNKV